jgi:hypothetical protein
VLHTSTLLLLSFLLSLLLLLLLLLRAQVPDVDWLVEKIQGFVDSGVLKGRPQHIWVNPDCGLKTRRWAEVIPSLRNMVEAAAIMRTRLAGTAAAAPAAGAATANAKTAGPTKAVEVATAGGETAAIAAMGPKVNACAGAGCCN